MHSSTPSPSAHSPPPPSSGPWLSEHSKHQRLRDDFIPILLVGPPWQCPFSTQFAGPCIHSSQRALPKGKIVFKVFCPRTQFERGAPLHERGRNQLPGRCDIGAFPPQPPVIWCAYVGAQRPRLGDHLASLNEVHFPCRGGRTPFHSACYVALFWKAQAHCRPGTHCFQRWSFARKTGVVRLFQVAK
eukprot:jgi/Botrbrau1/11780/Bobra.0195s0104.1